DLGRRSAGTGTPERACLPDAHAGTRRSPEPRARVPAERGSARRAARAEPRPVAPGTRGAARLREDGCLRRAAGIRRARGQLPRQRTGELLPQAAAEEIPRAD